MRRGYDPCCVFCTLVVASFVGGLIASTQFIIRFFVEVYTLLTPAVERDGEAETITWRILALIVALVGGWLLVGTLPPRPQSWQCVTARVGGEELERLRAEFLRACSAHQSKYRGRHIELVSAHRVSNDTSRERFEHKRAALRAKGKPDEVTRLYHGTSAWAARAIVKHGFQLPDAAGMFGRGIYFADSPLKSLQYTAAGWSCWFRAAGVMLVCDVALGNSKLQRGAATHLVAEAPDLRERGMIARMIFRAKSFDSVTAATGWLGAVRVPEFVVYDSAQAMPMYVLVVRETDTAGGKQVT